MKLDVAAQSIKPHPSKGWFFPFITITTFSVGMILLVAFKVHDFLSDPKNDLTGDGQVDLDDLIRYFSCGLSMKAWRNIGFVGAFSLAGFCFLWWMGYLQPILGALVVYAYLIVAVMAFVSIFVAEAWDKFVNAMGLLTDLVQKIQGFFDGGKEMLTGAQHRMEDMVGKSASSQSDARAGAK